MPLEIGHLSHRRGGVHAAQEADLGLVDVAQAGHHRLIQERVGDPPPWVGAEPAERLGLVPVLAE